MLSVKMLPERMGKRWNGEHQIPLASIRAVRSIAINSPASLFVSSFETTRARGIPVEIVSEIAVVLSLWLLSSSLIYIFSPRRRVTFIRIATFDSNRFEYSYVQQIDPQLKQRMIDCLIICMFVCMCVIPSTANWLILKIFLLSQKKHECVSFQNI